MRLYQGINPIVHWVDWEGGRCPEYCRKHHVWKLKIECCSIRIGPVIMGKSQFYTKPDFLGVCSRDLAAWDLWSVQHYIATATVISIFSLQAVQLSAFVKFQTSNGTKLKKTYFLTLLKFKFWEGHKTFHNRFVINKWYQNFCGLLRKPEF